MEVPDVEKPDLYSEMLFSERDVTKRVYQLAQLVIDQYNNKNPLFVCLMRGGVPFSAKLMFAIAVKDPYFHPELDYMTVRTYGSKLTSKKPEIIMDLSPSTVLCDRAVIILDDILDTGLTTGFVATQLLGRGAKSVDLIALIRKNKEQSVFEGEIIHGFETPPGWQTGMGLDDPRIKIEANRWASFVALANEQTLSDQNQV